MYQTHPKRGPATDAFAFLMPWLSRGQRHALVACCKGEEQDFFFEKVIEYADRIKAMPQTYQQDGLGEEAIVYLHYFTGGADWYITEKDSDPDGEGQVQAFGLADLFRDGGELGYISIPELLANGAELDLYWTPKPLKDARKS